MGFRSARSALTWAAALAVSVVCVYGVLAVLPARPSVHLSSISGSLERCDQGFCVGGGPVFFGPEWYLEGTSSRHDLNGDGRIGTLLEELNGIVGETAVVEVGAGAGEPRAYVVNGVPWREIEGAPPWSEPPAAAADPKPASQGQAATEPVPRSGALHTCGTGFCLDGAPLYLGPWWYLHHTTAAHDYDGDGTISTPASELEGLIGLEIEVSVLAGSQGDEVVTLNGLTWRASDGPPPWVGGPTDQSIGQEPAPEPSDQDEAEPAEDEAEEPEEEDEEQEEEKEEEKEEGAPISPPISPPTTAP